MLIYIYRKKHVKTRKNVSMKKYLVNLVTKIKKRNENEDRSYKE